MLNPSEQRPDTFESLSDWLRWQFSGVLVLVARLFAWTGVHPNTLTIVGLLLAIGAGVLAAQGMLVRAGVAFMIGGALDALDGPLARVTGRTSRFGAALDSVLDRYSEGALLGGLAFWMASNGATLGVMLVFATLLGSLLVSYVRARADGVELQVKVGLMTRAERFALLLLTLFSGYLIVGLAIMAVLVNFTVFQRLAEVYRLTRDD